MTRPKRQRVCIYFSGEDMSLTTNDLATIEQCLGYLRHSSTVRRDAPLTGERLRARIALEEFEGSLQVLWPGLTQQAKACHSAAIEAIFQTRSWSAVESKSAESCEEGAVTLRACEQALPREADGVAPTTRAEVLAWILAIQSERKEAQVI